MLLYVIVSLAQDSQHIVDDVVLRDAGRTPHRVKGVLQCSCSEMPYEEMHRQWTHPVSELATKKKS